MGRVCSPFPEHLSPAEEGLAVSVQGTVNRAGQRRVLSQRRVLLNHRAGVLSGPLDNVGIGERPQKAQGALRAGLRSTQNITLAALGQVDA